MSDGSYDSDYDKAEPNQRNSDDRLQSEDESQAVEDNNSTATTVPEVANEEPPAAAPTDVGPTAPPTDPLKPGIRARNFFLTFPQCNTTKEEALARVTRKWDRHIKTVVVGHELHQDGGHHLHLFIAFKGSHKVTNIANHFDFIGGKHGDYARARRADSSIAYCAKDGDIALFGIEEDKVKQLVEKWKKSKQERAKKKNTRDAIFKKALDCETKEEAEKTLIELAPANYCLGFNNIQKALQAVYYSPPGEYIPYPADSFTNITTYMDYFKTKLLPLSKTGTRLKMLIMEGPTGLGKTSWARSLGRHIYMKGEWNLAKWDQAATYLVVDDIPWHHFRPQTRKSLFTCSGECEVTDKYRKKQTIKVDMPTIFITNDTINFSPEEEYWKLNSFTTKIRQTLIRPDLDNRTTIPDLPAEDGILDSDGVTSHQTATNFQELFAHYGTQHNIQQQSYSFRQQAINKRQRL